MLKLNSLFFDVINNWLKSIQNKLNPLVENSAIFKNLDNIIFLFMCLTFVSSLFLPSEMIGIVALVVVFFTVVKILFLKGQDIELSSCNLFLLIFLLISFASVINSSLFAKSFYGFSKTLIYFSFYFSVVQFFRFNKDKIIPTLFVIAACASFEGIVGIVQNNIGLENISTWQDTSYINPEDVVSRIYGTLLPYNPNLLAGYLIAAFPAILGLGLISVKDKKLTSKTTIISIILMAITALTLFFTGCRGAYLAFGVIGLGIIVTSWQVIFKTEAFPHKLRDYWKRSIGAIAGLVVAVFVFVPSILKRLLSIFVMREDSSTSFRMNVYHSSIEMFRDNWLLGIGTGNKTFREIYGLYMMSGYDALSTYSVFLEMAVESGIFALLAYLAFLVVLLKNAVVRFLNEADLSKKIIIFTTFISVVAVMVHGLFDTIYFRPQVQFVYWTMVAILVVTITNKQEEMN